MLTHWVYVPFEHRFKVVSIHDGDVSSVAPRVLSRDEDVTGFGALFDEWWGFATAHREAERERRYRFLYAPLVYTKFLVCVRRVLADTKTIRERIVQLASASVGRPRDLEWSEHGGYVQLSADGAQKLLHCGGLCCVSWFL